MGASPVQEQARGEPHSSELVAFPSLTSGWRKLRPAGRPCSKQVRPTQVRTSGVFAEIGALLHICHRGLSKKREM